MAYIKKDLLGGFGRSMGRRRPPANPGAMMERILRGRREMPQLPLRPPERGRSVPNLGAIISRMEPYQGKQFDAYGMGPNGPVNWNFQRPGGGSSSMVGDFRPGAGPVQQPPMGIGRAEAMDATNSIVPPPTLPYQRPPVFGPGVERAEAMDVGGPGPEMVGQQQLNPGIMALLAELLQQRGSHSALGSRSMRPGGPLPTFNPYFGGGLLGVRGSHSAFGARGGLL